jgi:predicted nucleic acid-binding protein
VAVVLIDTSIWLEIERGRFDIEKYVEIGEIAICPPIAQELLQGARTADRYTTVWHTILSSRMLDDPMPLETFEEAAQIFRNCREDGYVIASPFDCLIASCAIRHGVPLLQRDRDFEKIAELAPLELLRNVG